MTSPHVWQDVTDELTRWMEETPDQIAQSIMGEQPPFQAQVSHDEQMQYHLEHLFPPQLGGQMDTAYLSHLLAVGTADQVKSLRQALDRYVQQKAAAPPPRAPAADPRGAGVTGTAASPGAPFPHLDRPAVLPPPPRQYGAGGY